MDEKRDFFLTHEREEEREEEDRGRFFLSCGLIRTVQASKQATFSLLQIEGDNDNDASGVS